MWAVAARIVSPERTTPVASETLPPRARAAGRAFAWVLMTALALAIICAVWVGVRGAVAYQHLSRIQDGAAESVAAVASDPPSAAPALARLASDAQTAHDLTSDPVWKLAEHAPWIGPQLAAFGTVAAASDELLRQSLLPLATAAQSVSVDALMPTGGRIDTSPLEQIAEPAHEAAVRARAAADSVDRIGHTPLVGVVGSAVGQADELFGQVAGAVDGLSRASVLLPTMLGQDGPREYLLLVQNNAEWRSLGGITGTTILLRADHGAISLVDTKSATGLTQQSLSAPVDLPSDVTAIYDTKPARYVHNLTQIPDFTVDGPLARETYKRKTGIEVDGVLAVDPVVLSYLLGAIGPVTLPTGDTLTADDAVPFLLNGVYLRYEDPATQDVVFAGAAGAVFQGLIDGRGSAGSLISALARAGDEHRFFLWSADATEQQILDDTTIAGHLPVTDDQTARFGVFLNDATGSKMSYYVSPTVSLAWVGCPSSATDKRLTLTATLTSDAPTDAATALPWYITGGGMYGTPPGIAKVVGNIYLPEGYELDAAQNSAGTGFAEAVYQGRRVMTFGTDLAPGQSTTVTVSVTAPSTVTSAEAYITPTADAALTPTVVATCGALG